MKRFSLIYALILLNLFSPAGIRANVARSLPTPDETPRQSAERQLREEQGGVLHQEPLELLLEKYEVTPHPDFPVDPAQILYGQASVTDSFGDNGGPATTKMMASRDGQGNASLVKRGKTIEEVVTGLKDGSVSPDALPVAVIQVNGEIICVNNRSLTALRMAGKHPTVILRMTPSTLPATGPDSLQAVLNRLEAMPENKGSRYSYIRVAGKNSAGVHRESWHWDAPLGLVVGPVEAASPPEIQPEKPTCRKRWSRLAPRASDVLARN